VPPRDRTIKEVRELLEQNYLASISEQLKHEYAVLNEAEKTAVLKAFLQKRIAGSEAYQWARVLQDML
jgi:deoxyribodipyrimidine photolyase-like uncharacterized protein